MTGRSDKERILRELYKARVEGDLATIAKHFSPDCRFEMAGSPTTSKVAVKTIGVGQYGPLITEMMRVFKLSDLQILSIVIEGDMAAVHWRVKVESSVTGDMVVTDLCDMVEFEGSRVTSFLQFCDTAMAARMMRAA